MKRHGDVLQQQQPPPKKPPPPPQQKRQGSILVPRQAASIVVRADIERRYFQQQPQQIPLPVEMACMIFDKLRSPDLRSLAMSCVYFFVTSANHRKERMALGCFHPLNLSDEQAWIYWNVVDEEKNVFVSGAAGTGKSLLIRACRFGLESIRGRRVVSCAPTGIAALHLEAGCTIHSLFAQSESILRTAQVFIIDEVSMASAALLEQLNNKIRVARTDPSIHGNPMAGSDRAFGGAQVLMCGDIAQLPPVGDGAKPCFASTIWREIFPPGGHCCLQAALIRPLRQFGDGPFIEALNAMRFGMPVDPTHRAVIERCAAPLECFSPAERALFTRSPVLYYQNASVDQENERRLNALPSELQIFKGTLTYRLSNYILPALGDIPSIIKLKVGALIMFRRNCSSSSARVANGTRGHVVAFIDLSSPDGVDEAITLGAKGIIGGAGLGYRWQRVSEDLQALFRDQNSDRKLFERRSAQEDDIEEHFMHRIPLVELSGGGCGQRILVMPVIARDRDVKTRMIIQLPLSLAYAFTIHRSQGLTLDAVTIDLRTCKTRELIYTALSRVRSSSCLRLLTLPNWDMPQTVGQKIAKTFYDSLSTLYTQAIK
jgi:hypothetical protein